MAEKETNHLEAYLKLTKKKFQLIGELGEKTYARKLGEHVAMLMNNGLMCKSFTHNEIYGSLEQNDMLYLDIKKIIAESDGKGAEINYQCEELKRNNPIISKYLNLDEQLFYLQGTVEDDETRAFVEENKTKIKSEIKDVLEEDKQENNVIEKYLNLREEQSRIYFQAYNQENKFENQFFYLGSIIADIQNQMRSEGKSEDEQTSIIEAYVEGFISELDFEKYGEVIGRTKIGAERNFKRTLQPEENIATRVSTYRYGNNTKINDSIYQANEKYNSFYSALADTMKKTLELIKSNEIHSEASNEEPEEIDRKVQEIKKIKLSDILEGNDFFHFTREKAIPKIVEQGLRGDLDSRENAVGNDYENPSVYFSKGEIGVLKTIDVWLRWEYEIIARGNGYPDGCMITVPSALEKTFRKAFEDFKERRYFQLDLVEGDDKETSDFSYDSEDFKKKGSIEGGGPTRRTRWMLGSYTNWKTPRLEDWNMMTHIWGRPIEIDRMKMIVTEQGKSDALSVIEEIYKRSRGKENIDLRYLDSFIKYVKALTIQQEKNATTNIGRSIIDEFSEVEKMSEITELIRRETRSLNQGNEIEQK